MATFFSGEYVDYWSSTANRVYGTLTGDVVRNGDTVTLTNLNIYLESSQQSWGTSPWSFTIGSSTTSTTISAPPTNVGLNSYSFSVSPAQTSATVSWNSPENSGSFDVSFPARVTPPTGLAVSNITKGVREFSADVSVTGWGGAGDANSRYRELQVWTRGFVEPRRYQIARGNALSSRIKTDNDAPGGSLIIKPNTRYTLGAYASNGTYNTGSVQLGEYTTLPEAADLTFVSTDGETATIVYQTKADGGHYPKILEYSLDNGNTWKTGATVSGGAAQSGEFVIPGLQPGNTYTVLTRTRTQAGFTNGDTISFTASTLEGYGSVNNQTKKILRAYGSVNGEAKRIVAGYRSVNGLTKKLF